MNPSQEKAGVAAPTAGQGQEPQLNEIHNTVGGSTVDGNSRAPTASNSLQAASQYHQYPSGGPVAASAPSGLQPVRWASIPRDLRDTAQWCIAAPDKSPYTVAGKRAVVTAEETWDTFDRVAQTATAWGAGIGFVLDADDGFCCIDLDVKESTTPEQMARFEKIVQAFDSYTERSRSGKGYHIWIRGKVGPGARRDGVEIYSQERFIICTGDVFLDRPIRESGELLVQLYTETKGARNDAHSELVDLPPAATDETIYHRAMEATNGAKFSELWAGQWQGKTEYPSQSEADLSLLSMLAFYSKSNSQVRRMFRLSALGQREKATKNDKYLNRTLSVIRGRQQEQDDHVALLTQCGISNHRIPNVTATHSHPSDTGRTIVGRNLDAVQMRAIDWLWTGWIPKGYITLWAGETGAGKSTLLADVAARVTRGSPWPGESQETQREPGRVLWLGSEDGIEEMTVPRLAACGANLRNITEIQGVVQNGRRNSFSMQDDLDAVRQGLATARDSGMPFVMLVIDPITSYLSGQKLKRVDLNDGGQLRTILEPWMQVAQEHNLAIVCVTHFAKDTTRSMLHRVVGSAAFAQTCRSLCTVVAREGEDDGPYDKALIQVKVNLPEHPGGAWKFSTVKVQVGIDSRNGKSIDATRPEWQLLDSALTPKSVMGGKRGPISKDIVPFGIWLRAHFAHLPPGARLPVREVKAAAIVNRAIPSEKWWDEHSRQYMEKVNEGGTWYCWPRFEYETT